MKSIEQIMKQTSVLDIKGYKEDSPLAQNDFSSVAAEDYTEYSTTVDLKKGIEKLKKDMQKAAKDLDFMEAARLRDEMFKLEKMIKE